MAKYRILIADEESGEVYVDYVTRKDSQIVSKRVLADALRIYYKSLLSYPMAVFTILPVECMAEQNLFQQSNLNNNYESNKNDWF